MNESAADDSRNPVTAVPHSGKLDRKGRYRMWSEVSVAVVGFYSVLILFLVYSTLVGRLTAYPTVTIVLAATLAVFLARTLSTHYILDSEYLRARRLFGSRKLKLSEVRKIDFANLRDLGPIGFFGSWGWRGRMWGPSVGTFDSVYTVSRGLLVRAGPVPLFISPKDPDEFARELSRRVRSFGDLLESEPRRPLSWSKPGTMI